MNETNRPANLRVAIGDQLDGYAFAKLRDKELAISDILRLCEAAALACLEPQPDRKYEPGFINGWSCANDTAQANIHSVFGGTQR